MVLERGGAIEICFNLLQPLIKSVTSLNSTSSYAPISPYFFKCIHAN